MDTDLVGGGGKRVHLPPPVLPVLRELQLWAERVDLASAPILTANWRAAPGQQWVVPFNCNVSAYHNAVRHDIGQEWSVRVVVTLRNWRLLGSGKDPRHLRVSPGRDHHEEARRRRHPSRGSRARPCRGQAGPVRPRAVARGVQDSAGRRGGAMDRGPRALDFTPAGLPGSLTGVCLDVTEQRVSEGLHRSEALLKMGAELAVPRLLPGGLHQRCRVHRRSLLRDVRAPLRRNGVASRRWPTGWPTCIRMTGPG